MNDALPENRAAHFASDFFLFSAESKGGSRKQHGGNTRDDPDTGVPLGGRFHRLLLRFGLFGLSVQIHKAQQNLVKLRLHGIGLQNGAEGLVGPGGNQIAFRGLLPDGLIAAGLLNNPLEYAHIVTSTTHKTLRGPRGGIILLGKDFDNPWGKTTKKGVIRKMSSLLDSAVFPGVQGGPLEHVIAAKAVAFGEALQPEFKVYAQQVKKNAAVMAQAFVDKGYKICSGGTENHCMLIDLRTKFPELTGKVAENALVAADITVNKNMVPYDTRSAFQTSGLRVGTPAMTTRGAKEELMPEIVELIDTVLKNPESEANIASVREKVNAIMKDYPIFAW